MLYPCCGTCCKVATSERVKWVPCGSVVRHGIGKRGAVAAELTPFLICGHGAPKPPRQRLKKGLKRRKKVAPTETAGASYGQGDYIKRGYRSIFLFFSSL